ncbi:hypothetical protein [Williamsia sp. CHRR-6]|uniref:restriction endonuclease subunit S n=1 Tax=Williamsia sp. CHRR-6 TaxID=2835871 RepID=UPI001BDB67DC|nr:hypothetical protein [Williamsia sp. CHRR-6]MBT0567689.1 hypothetical protein [Williamsia sp. CHRR-6]
MSASATAWRIQRLRYLLSVDPPVASYIRDDPDRMVSFLPMEAVGENGGLDLSREIRAADALAGYTFVADGDVLLAKVTPCFENGKGSVVTGLVGGAGFATTEVYTLRPGPDVHARFLDYLLQSRVFRAYGTARLTGAGGLKRLSATDLRNFEARIPSHGEQVAIADFLDRETARIDTLIEEQQRLIDLLRERRVDAVAGALQGLQGRTRLKYRAIIQTGVTLNGEGDPAWPEWPYLRVANVQVGRVDLTEVKTIRLKPEDAAASSLLPGDVLMTEGGDIDKLGRGALWSGHIPNALHQNHVFAVRPDEGLLPEFLVYVLDGPEARGYFMTTAKKTTNLASTNKWTLGNLPLACPSVGEQRRVVNYLDEQIEKIDRLVAEAERFIELSRERRAALITAAVTGQIDVRGTAA